MTMNRWQELYSKLFIRTQPDAVRLPLPTDKALDEFETVTKFKLPISYRNYCKVFGAGELADEFRIRAPGYLPSTGYSLQHFNEDIQRQIDANFLTFYSKPDKLQRLIYFASANPGDLIGWDPQDIRDAQTHEYAIYEIGYDGKLPLRAITFAEFIVRHCLGEGKKEQDDARWTFRPLCKVLGTK